VFWPNQISNPFIKPTQVLPEIRLSFEFKQPGFIESRTNLSLSGAFYLYCPLINCLPPKVPDPTQPLVGYRQYSGRTGLDRSFFNGQFAAGQYINVQLYDPFSYNYNLLPAGYSRVLVSYLETTSTVDLRTGEGGKRDKINPHSGVYLTTDIQLAGLGGDAKDFLFRPELRAFAPVTRKSTLAFRLTTGLLFPFANSYGWTLASEELKNPGFKPSSETVSLTARDLQLMRIRGLFSGGQNSNRGYGYHQIGPAAPLTFIYPPIHAPIPGQPVPDDPQAPVGGLTLWESSLELRIPVGGKLGTTIFADASDVTLKAAQLRLTHPHLSAGLGLRYETPVGPLRFDVGYRIPGMQVVGQKSVDACAVNCKVVTDEQAPTTVFGLPIAIALTIGEAF
jgi:outer membrane protein insertion porin family/translocation and assembly module TamA